MTTSSAKADVMTDNKAVQIKVFFSFMCIPVYLRITFYKTLLKTFCKKPPEQGLVSRRNYLVSEQLITFCFVSCNRLLNLSYVYTGTSIIHDVVNDGW